MVKKKSSTTKPKKKRTIESVKQDIFLNSSKFLIAQLSNECPKEILAKSYDFLKNLFIQNKEYLLETFAKSYTNENKEKVWLAVVDIYNDILRPLEDAQKQINANTMQQEAQKFNFAIKQYQANHGTIENETSSNSPYWPNPLDIDYIRQKVADDVATIRCKIGPMEIPYAMVDSGSDSSVISDNIVKQLGLDIDKRKIYRLKGYATYAHTIGASNIPITIGDDITEPDEFSVVKAEKDKYGREKSLVVLGIPWQYKVGWTPVKEGVFEGNHHGKPFKIPMSVHKVNRTLNSFHLEKNNGTGFGTPLLKKT